jgi:hypothetical protein
MATNVAMRGRYPFIPAIWGIDGMQPPVTDWGRIPIFRFKASYFVCVPGWNHVGRFVLDQIIGKSRDQNENGG